MGDEPRVLEATAPLDPGGSHALIRSFRLSVEDGQDRGLAFSSKSERTVIGTDPTADLVLTDPTVSRFHCEIVLVDGRAVVRDLRSRNGTTVDRVAVLAAPLAAGAMLGVGRSTVRFDIGLDVVKLPLSARTSFGVLVGRSPAMRRVFALLEKAAASDATVLIDGETGTGKEAAAESIHRESARHAGPLVVVDCGAIPGNLLESELFGHERGAFTGAAATREGAFEAADGGTIFLDEIGELSPELQPKLLRVLERREVKRVGANRYRPLDVRVLAATNRNLRVDVNERRFRSDLYFRLAVIEVRLPPLRERSEDIPALVEHFLGSLAPRGGEAAEFVRDPAFQADLLRHPWPGNVRELRNHVERCLALQERLPLPTELPELEAFVAQLRIDLDLPLRDIRDRLARLVERRYVEAVLQRHGNNVTAAARTAGIDRIHFYRLLSRHGLRPR